VRQKAQAHLSATVRKEPTLGSSTMSDSMAQKNMPRKLEVVSKMSEA
jgi:hypothetical protein